MIYCLFFIALHLKNVIHNHHQFLFNNIFAVFVRISHVFVRICQDSSLLVGVAELKHRTQTQCTLTSFFYFWRINSAYCFGFKQFIECIEGFRFSRNLLDKTFMKTCESEFDDFFITYSICISSLMLLSMITPKYFSYPLFLCSYGLSNTNTGRNTIPITFKSRKNCFIHIHT